MMKSFSIDGCAHWIDVCDDVVKAANKVGNNIDAAWLVDNVLPDGEWHLGWKHGAFDAISIEMFVEQARSVIADYDEIIIDFTYETDVRFVIIPCDDTYGNID